MRTRISASLEALALALWVGSLAAFAFVFAPAAFHAIDDLTVFGELIGTVLRTLGALGILCGLVAIVAILAGGFARTRSGVARLLLVAGMIALTAYVTTSVIPEMETTARSFHGPFASIARADPRRIAYDGLHARSSRTYALVLLMGTAAIVLAAATEKRSA